MTANAKVTRSLGISEVQQVLDTIHQMNVVDNLGGGAVRVVNDDQLSLAEIWFEPEGGTWLVDFSPTKP